MNHCRGLASMSLTSTLVYNQPLMELRTADNFEKRKICQVYGLIVDGGGAKDPARGGVVSAMQVAGRQIDAV